MANCCVQYFGSSKQHRNVSHLLHLFCRNFSNRCQKCWDWIIHLMYIELYKWGGGLILFPINLPSVWLQTKKHRTSKTFGKMCSCNLFFLFFPCWIVKNNSRIRVFGAPGTHNDVMMKHVIGFLGVQKLYVNNGWPNHHPPEHAFNRCKKS